MPDLPPLAPEEFAGILDVSRETLARLAAYVGLLAVRNREFNLVSETSLGDVWRRHVLDSAQVFPLIPATARRIVDVGSGAGFPGLVVAACLAGRQDIHSTLVDSIGKKCGFLREAVELMGLAGQVSVIHGRAETVTASSADVMTARAVAPIATLIGYGAHLLRPTGCAILLKGARVDVELTAARRSWNIRVERRTSLSDPSGTLLIVKDFSRVRRSQPGRT